MLKRTIFTIIPAAIVLWLAAQKVQVSANVLAVSLPKPEPVCGPVCAIFCECGNILDHRGCPTCRCKKCEPAKCPLRRCARPINCPFGVKKVNGCPTCECNPGPVICPLRRCARPINCPLGVKKVNGCPTCECNPGPADCSKTACPPNLAIKCQYGIKIINGCPTCSCNSGPVKCPLRRCARPINCPFGVKKVNGCPTCECNPALREPRPCRRLSRNQCRRRCRLGYLTSERSQIGCPHCLCRGWRGYENIPDAYPRS